MRVVNQFDHLRTVIENVQSSECRLLSEYDVCISKRRFNIAHLSSSTVISELLESDINRYERRKRFVEDRYNLEVNKQSKKSKK